MQDRHPILAGISILIALKVIAITSITLLLMFVLPLFPEKISRDATDETIYMAVEELGANEKDFCRYRTVMSEEFELLREMIENGTEPIYATRLFLNLCDEVYQSRALAILLGVGFFWLCGIFMLIESGCHLIVWLWRRDTIR